MLGRIITFIALLTTWLVFSGMMEPFFIICGIVSCVVALYISLKMTQEEDATEVRLGVTLRGLGYSLWLLKEIVISSVDVAVRIWKEKPDIAPILTWVPTKQTTDIGKTIYANSITLTPGTVCLNVEGDMMQVHALSQEGITSLRCGYMDDNISKMLGK